tara:strand:+ start:138 stop:455 length:318 start_codon:yes stop_codon:yes gene_type:complete
MTNISLEVTGLNDYFTDAILERGILITSVERSCNGHYEIYLTGQEDDLLHIVTEYMDDDSLDIYRTNEILPMDKLNNAAISTYGEFGFSTLSISQQEFLINKLFS